MGRTGLHTQRMTLQKRLMGTGFLASANITGKTVPGNRVRASRTLSSEQKQANHHDCVSGALTCVSGIHGDRHVVVSCGGPALSSG